jgi:Tol biopolymer transport system component
MSKATKVSASKLALGDEQRLTAGYAHHHAPTWSHDGHLLAMAVGNARDASWVLVDRRGRVARSLEGPAAGMASFAPDGSFAFERRFGTVSEIWLTPGGDAPPVRLLGGDGRLYRDPCFSPDGKTLACAASRDPEGKTHLMLLRLDDGRMSELTHDAERADGRPAFTPGGEELVFEGTVGDDHAIYGLHLLSHALRRLTPAGERARRPAVIDGARIVYERQAERGPSSLVLLDRERERALPLFLDGAEDDGASRGEPTCFVSASGKVRIAYAVQPAPNVTARGEPPRFDVFVARLRGVQVAVARPEEEPAPAQAEAAQR